MGDSANKDVDEQTPFKDGEAPLAYRAVRGGLWVVASSYWTIGVGFIATVVITRLLEPEAFGIFALATFFVQLLRLQPKFGLGYAFAQHKDTTGKEIGTYCALELAAASASFLLSLVALPILSRLGYSGTLVQVSAVLAFAVAMEGIAGIGSTLLDKQLHFRQLSFVQSLVFPVSYVPALWLALNSAGVWSLVAQNLTYNALLLIGVWWIVRRHLPKVSLGRGHFDAALARRFLAFGMTVGLGLLAAMLLTQLDNFLIGTLVSVSVLGFYDRAYRTAQWPSTLLNSLISRAAYFTYAKLQDDLARLQKTVTMILWLITSLALPLALVIFIAAPDLLVLLYGEKWLPSALFLRILVTYSVLRPLWDNAGAMFLAVGKPRFVATLAVVQALILAISGIPLTLLWGAVGTCIAVGLAFAVGIVTMYRNLGREVPIKLGGVLGAPAVVAVATLLGYLALSRMVALNDLSLPMRVAVKSAYAISAFFALTMLVQPRTTRERVAYIWRLASST